MWLERIISPSPRFVPSVREAVGVFNNPEDLQAALDDLEQNGFMRQEISVRAPNRIIGDGIAHRYTHVSRAEDDPKAPRTAFVPEEIIGELEGSVIGLPLYVSAIAGTCIVAGSGSTLPTTMAAAAAAGAAGAGIGTLVAKYIAGHHAERLQEHMDRGGLLLWAAVRDEEQERKARRVLSRHSAHNVHIHEIPLSARP